jgi:hypothetical protein
MTGDDGLSFGRGRPWIRADRREGLLQGQGKDILQITSALYLGKKSRIAEFTIGRPSQETRLC